MKTPFEIAQEQVKNGELNTPKVIADNKSLDYFGYQLAVHKYNLSLMAMGLKSRQVTFTQIKKYYGLKGKSAKECLPELSQMVEDYKVSLNN
jgi:hypothetical protein